MWMLLNYFFYDVFIIRDMIVDSWICVFDIQCIVRDVLMYNLIIINVKIYGLVVDNRKMYNGIRFYIFMIKLLVCVVCL